MTGPDINLNIVLMYCSIKRMNYYYLVLFISSDKLLGIETHTTFLLKWREYVIAISAEDEAYY